MSKPLGVYTRNEVKLHNKDDDCWLIIEDGVYNVSDFVRRHPGGKIITTYAGLDATDVFVAMHPDWINTMIPKFKIGTVKYDPEYENSPHAKFVRETRALRQSFVEKGYFKSNKWFFYKLVTINWILFTSAFYLLHLFPKNLLAHVVSGMLLALFWQQNGWLSHDFLHYSVFKTRFENWIIPFIMGEMMSGYGYIWWSRKHNKHHALPNILEGDPDINTHPIFTWTPKDTKMKKHLPLSPLLEWWLKHQSWFLFPLLAFARINWTIDSLKTIQEPTEWRWRDIPAMGFYWLWSLGLPFYFLSPMDAIRYYFFSQAFSGVILAGTFVLNHSGMEMFDEMSHEHTDFFRLQVLSSRAVTSGPLVDWFTGGLNFQIEHHIYPRMPRHNLKKIQPIIKEFCAKHNIRYHETNFFSGLWEVLKHLKNVGVLYDEMPGGKKVE